MPVADEIRGAIAKLEASSIVPYVLTLVASAIGYKVGLFSRAPPERVDSQFEVTIVAIAVAFVATMYAFGCEIFARRSGRWELATHYRSLPPRVRRDTLRDRL